MVLSWHLCFPISSREASLWSDFCDIYVGYLNCTKDCMSVHWQVFSYALPEISMVLPFPWHGLIGLLESVHGMIFVAAGYCGN